MIVRNIVHVVEDWSTGVVIRFSWECDGKLVRTVLRATNGARYVPPSGLSKEDKALAAFLGAKTQAEAKRVLAAPENRKIVDADRATRKKAKR